MYQKWKSFRPLRRMKRAEEKMLETPLEEKEKQETHSKGGNGPIQMGPMQIQQQPMSVLLVFAKEDAQSDGFWWAADKASYVCNLSRSTEEALETYLEHRHHLVILDARTTRHFDAEALCRSIRKSSESTVIVAVTKKVSTDKEEPSIVPLLNAGFNRRFIENPSISVCLNELVTLEHGEVVAQLKLSAAHSWLKALELSSEAVQITNDQHVTQYVNPAYERLFGYNCEELQGVDAWSLPPPGDKLKQETILARLRKGEAWEGINSSKKKGGESVTHHCRITPVHTGSTVGKMQHYVSIKSPFPDASQGMEKYPADLNQLTNGGVHTHTTLSNRRRESVARIHSMSLEAPITKVINIINTAQENSSMSVASALDKVLEILQSSELYSPFFGAQVMKDDQMTNDLVGGLMATSMKRRFSGQEHGAGGLAKNTTVTSLASHQTSTPQVLSNIPQNIQDLLNTEEAWDFDVLQLERITNKRALAYLGLKTFQRFGVMDYLRCPEETMCNWLQMIEANYHTSNTYHNSTHAADVMQASAYFLARDRIKNIMEPTDEVVSLIAAIVHDLNHPGKTNSFLCNAGHELAILYNDLAVLESHHAALAFQLTCKDDQLNIFKNVDKEDYKMIRQQIIDMVLATEMTKHFEHLSKFVSSANALTKDEEREAMSLSGRSSPDSVSTASAATSQQQRMSTMETRMLIKRMLIKCADVSNPLRPLKLCKEWAFRISEEYFKQTDEEKRLELPVVMPVFDRKTCNVPKSQTSFIDFFIKDMFDAWDSFCDIPEPIKQLQINFTYWKEQEPKAEHELQERRKRDKEEAEGEANDTAANESQS